MTITSPPVSVPSVRLLVGGDGARASRAGSVLGSVRFGPDPGGVTVRDGSPVVSVQVGADRAEQAVEVWSTTRPVRSGREGPIHFATDGEALFCAFHIPESPRYADATDAAYARALALTDAMGYRPSRIWHYISRINAPNATGLETYRDFCVGRARALARLGRTQDMPAATVIGAAGGGIVCHLLAFRSGRQVNLENPRQVPAYHYPVQHGPASPNFARATYLDHGGAGEFLFVSGTASILGHRTAHVDDVAAQARLALDNVACLIGPGNLRAHGIAGGHTVAELDAVKVYVRRPADIPVVRDVLSAEMSPGAQVVYLPADVCRSDLLVELEGVVGRRVGAAA